MSFVPPRLDARFVFDRLAPHPDIFPLALHPDIIALAQQGALDAVDLAFPKCYIAQLPSCTDWIQVAKFPSPFSWRVASGCLTERSFS